MESYVRSYVNKRVFAGHFTEYHDLSEYDPDYTPQCVYESSCIRDMRYLKFSYMRDPRKEGRVLNLFYFHGNGENVRDCQARALLLTRELVILENEYSDFDTCHFYMFEYPSYCPFLSYPVGVKVDDITRDTVEVWSYDVARTIEVDIVRREGYEGARNVFMGYSLGCGFSLNVLQYLIRNMEANPIEECILLAPFISLSSIWRHHHPTKTWLMSALVIDEEEVDYFPINKILCVIRGLCNEYNVINLHITVHICNNDKIIVDYEEVIKMFKYIINNEYTLDTVIYSGTHSSLGFNNENNTQAFYSSLRKNIKKAIDDEKNKVFLLI